MAKITAPLLSLSASGSVANTLNYSKYKSVSYVRFKSLLVKARDSKTIKQFAWRDFFTTIYFIWKNLSVNDREILTELQKGKPMTGWNIFAKMYMLRKPTDAGNTRAGLSTFGNLEL